MQPQRFMLTKFALAALMAAFALWATAQIQIPKEIPEPQPLAIVTPAKPIPAPAVRAELVDTSNIPGPDQVILGLIRHGLQPQALHPDSLWEIDRLTAYNAVPEQTDNDPTTASCGPLAHANLPVLAISRERFLAPDGSKPHCGREAIVIAWNKQGDIILEERRLVYDTMAARFERTADLLLPGEDPTNANQWGVQQGLIALLPQKHR